MDKHSNAQDYERHPIQTITEFKILKTQLKNQGKTLHIEWIKMDI